MSNTVLPVTETPRLPDGPRGLLIDGAFVDAADGATMPVYNPATGEVQAEVAVAGQEDVDRAVRAARRAFEEGPWRDFTPSARGKVLWRLADLVEEHAEELALIETLDNGKPLAESRGDIAFSVEVFRYYAGAATRIEGRTVTPSIPGHWHAYTRREPVGVVGQIIPWNFPLMMASWKLAPALAVGCTVVLKPAEQTPLSALRLGELLLEAGLPPGVVNIVNGVGAVTGAAIAAHDGVDKVAFTGSAETGRAIVQAAMGNLKKVSLELGGKSPNIVFADADLEAATAGAAAAIFSHMGEVCIAGSRLYVQQDVFDDVVNGVAEQATCSTTSSTVSRNRPGGCVSARARIRTPSSARWFRRTNCGGSLATSRTGFAAVRVRSPAVAAAAIEATSSSRPFWWMWRPAREWCVKRSSAPCS